MIRIDIPGRTTILLEYLVIDFNGTLATDGSLIHRVREKLNELSENIDIHVVTADTFGKAKDETQNVKCKLIIIKGENQNLQKARYIEGLEEKKVVAIGNGMNDTLMLKNSALGIAVIQQEGIAVESLQNADIICSNILDAIDLLLKPMRIVATLRN